MNRAFKIFFSLLALHFTSILNAEARTLTILGDPKLTATVEGEVVHLTGSFEIENRGDEGGYNVIPVLTLGGWNWAGDPKNIEQNKKVSWDIDQSFDRKKLSCANTEICVTDDLPLKGSFPLLILRTYEDANGYQFSSADVKTLLVGDLSQDEMFAIRVPSIQGRVLLNGNGQKYDAELTLSGRARSDKNAIVSFYTTRELRVLTRPQTATVKYQVDSSYRANIENYRGLLGSVYAVFSIFQWEENGVRVTNYSSALTSVEKARQSPVLLYCGIGAVILFLFSLYWFVFRPSGKAKKL